MKTRIVSWAIGAALFVALTAQGFSVMRETTLRSYVHKMSDAGEACSAVMIAPGRAMTAKHCTDMTAPKLTINEQDYLVMEAYGNPTGDIAVLIVPDAPCPCAPVAVQPVQRDQVTTTVGYPFGLLQIVTEGVMQGRATVDDAEYLVTTARSAPGMSGGGLFNAQGELVGIISATDGYGLLTLAVETFSHQLEVK